MAPPTISLTLTNARWELAAAIEDSLTFTPAGGSDTTITTTDSNIVGRPAGSLVGAEVTLIVTTTGVVTTRRVDNNTNSGTTATLTVRSLGSTPDNTYTGEIHRLDGRGYTKFQYDKAINDAIRSLADIDFTDTDAITLAYESGQGTSTRRGVRRVDYPMPSGFNKLWAIDYLNQFPMAHNGSGNLDTYRALGDATARTRLGQGFQVVQDCLIEYIVVYLAKVGAPTDNVTSVLTAGDGASPDLPGTTLTNGTSGNLGGASVQTTGRWHVLRHHPPVIANRGTQYHLTLRRSGAVDASNYFIVGEDLGAAYYAAYGTLELYGGATWSAVTTSDLLFAVFAPGAWIEMNAHRWEYTPGSSDELQIKRALLDATPMRLRGGAAISEPAAESTVLPIRPEWLVAEALSWLQTGRSGMATSDPRGTGAAAWEQKSSRLPAPWRHLPPNTVNIVA